MKPDAHPQPVPASPARVEFQVRFSVGPRRGRSAPEPSVDTAPPKVVDSHSRPKAVATTEHVPKVTRLLVLAHHFERLVRDGAVKDYAEIARLTGLTRARVTQIVNLTLLTPEIQDAVLRPAQAGLVTERSLRLLISLPHWCSQGGLWESLVRSLADR